MNPDFLHLLRALCAAEARFLVVGGYGVVFHGTPRATAGLDLWVQPSQENAQRVYQALVNFGAPLEQLTVEDLATPGLVFHMGLPPRPIDLLTALTGLAWEEARAGRVEVTGEGVTFSLSGREAWVKNKQSLGLLQDLWDLERLQGCSSAEEPRA